MNRLIALLIFIPFAISGFSQISEENEYINTLGNFKEFTFDEKSLLIVAENGKLKITHYTKDIIRISVSKDEFGPDFNYSVIRKPEGEFSLRHNWSVFELTTPSLRIVVNRYPVYVSIYDSKGNLLNEDHPEMAYTFTKTAAYCFKKIQNSEVFVSPFYDNANPILNNKSLSWPNSGLYIGIHNKVSYGIFTDNLKGSSFDFGTLYLNDNYSANTYFATNRQEINYYIIAGKDPRELIKNYSYLVGLPFLPPLWSMKNIYESELSYKLINCLVSKKDSMQFYAEGIRNNYYLKCLTGNAYKLNTIDNEYSFLDFTNPLASSWRMKSYFSGINQSDTSTMFHIEELGNKNIIPDFLIADFEGHPMTFDYAHNAWGFLISKSAYESLSKKIDRPFIYTYFNFPGIHKYSAKINPIGNEDSYYLLIKNAFSSYSNAEFNVMVLDSIKTFIEKTRERLLPYIYSNYKIFSESCFPVKNSMAIIYPEISKQNLSKFNTQFVFCNDILLCPTNNIIPKDHEVFLPFGSNWYLLQKDTIYQGGKTYSSPAYQNFIPAFIKSSAIIPQRSLYDNSDTLFIHIYNGDKENTFKYYEDDGISNNYKKGQYYSRKITFHPTNKLILISPVSGSYSSIYRKLAFVFHGFEFEKKLKINGSKLAIDNYNQRPAITIDNIVSEIEIYY